MISFSEYGFPYLASKNEISDEVDINFFHLIVKQKLLTMSSSFYLYVSHVFLIKSSE